MIDNDKLRTALANERTFLAYIRTALSAGIFGMAAVKFFAENFLIVCLGFVVGTGGIVLLLWGFVQHQKHKKMLL